MKSEESKTKLQIGTAVKHVTKKREHDLGKGCIVDTCKDSTKVQVNFKKEPPRPLRYRFSTNPFVVPISELEVVKNEDKKTLTRELYRDYESPIANATLPTESLDVPIQEN